MSEKHDYLLNKWKLLIEDRVNSGMNVIEWCNANGYTKHNYYYWLAQLRKSNYSEAIAALLPVPAGPNNPGDLVEIPVPAGKPCLLSTSSHSAPSSPSAVIRKGDVSIELYPESDPALIKQFLEALNYA